MLIRWALYLFKRAGLVIFVILALVLLGTTYGPSVFNHVESNGQDFQDPNSESAAFSQQYPEQFPNTQGQFLVLFASPKVSVDDPTYASEVKQFMAEVSKVPHVSDVSGFYKSGNVAFVSTDRYDTFISISADAAYQGQVYDTLVSKVAAVKGVAVASLGGAGTINFQINEQVKRDLKKAEFISFPILAVLLLLFFGSGVAAMIPLGLGGLSIVCALCVMRLLTEVTTISAYAINVVTLLGLGLAIDYSLFMVGRFREELEKHHDVEVALAVAVNQSGRTILLSGTMVSISLLSLTVFPQTLLRSIGLGGAAVVATTVLLSITMLPAVLRKLGRNVNALPVAIRRKPDIEIPTYSFWYQFSTKVMGWAVPAFVVVLVPLLLTANQFRHAHLSSTDISTVPKTLSSRQVNSTLVQRFESFNSEPITILVERSSDPMSPTAITGLQQYVGSLLRIPGVTSVDSILGHTSPDVLASSQPTPEVQALRAQYVSGDNTIITVHQSYPPESDAARQLVGQIRGIPAPAGSVAITGGVSAQLTDLLRSLRAHLPDALIIVCSATFILVFLLTGSVVMPVKAIALDLLSLCTALGILVWIFQENHLTAYVPLTALGSVDATAAILIFVVAFGLSADYEFFLLSRVKEEYDATGDTSHAIAFGVQRTAGIITAAALLFVSVIGLFMSSKISLLQQIGLGLSVAVIIDATIIRLVLVAATMRILGKANWWAPRPLKTLHQKFGPKLH